MNGLTTAVELKARADELFAAGDTQRARVYLRLAEAARRIGGRHIRDAEAVDLAHATVTVRVATLTVDDGNLIVTSVHPTVADAERCLFDNYDAENEFDGDIQALLDAHEIAVYFDESTVEGAVVVPEVAK